MADQGIVLVEPISALTHVYRYEDLSLSINPTMPHLDDNCANQEIAALNSQVSQLSSQVSSLQSQVAASSSLKFTWGS